MSINPVDNRGAYLNILIARRPFPGRIVKGGIRGLGNEEEWSTVRPVAGTGWQQTHKGRLPVKGIEIECSLDGRDEEEVKRAWIEHYLFVVFLRGGVPPPAPLVRRSFAVTGTPFKGSGVLSVVYVKHVEPIYDTGALRVIYKFDEATKAKLFPVGPPEAAILNELDPQPKTRQETALRDAVVATRGAGGPPPAPGEISSRYPGVGAAGQ